VNWPEDRDEGFDVRDFVTSAIDEGRILPDEFEELESLIVDRPEGDDTEVYERFPLLTVDDIIKRPPPRWLLEPFIPAEQFGLCVADSGVGKTLLFTAFARW